VANSTLPDLVKTTEIFLIPSSFLVAALGTADTNAHRAMVSLVGLVVSLLWCVSSREALADWEKDHQASPPIPLPRRIRVLGWLPIVFVTCWTISLVGHVALWQKPLGTDVLQVEWQAGESLARISVEGMEPSNIAAPALEKKR
jgi:hypothetical protein